MTARHEDGSARVAGRNRFGSPSGVKHGLGLAALLAGCLQAGAGMAQVTSLSHLYVFGDSLSDSGNSGVVSNGQFTPPPYFENRFTNGPVAVEYLWQKFNPGNTSFQPSLKGGSNYAIGGASTGVSNQLETGLQPGPPLNSLYANKGNAWQLANFNPAPFDASSSLFMLWLFPNDPLYYLGTGGFSVGTYNGNPGGPVPINQVPSNAVSNIIGSLQTLVNQGAEKFFVVNSPDLGRIPLFANTPNSGLMTSISNGFNTLLEVELATFKSSNPQLEINTFKLDQLVNAIIDDPIAYGFTNASQPCFNGVSVCSDPSTYLFWDDLHPTTSAHAYLADRFYSSVYVPPTPGTGVPGPLPVLGGLTALGWSRRLRKRVKQMDPSQATARAR